jgi:probable rRNA maturation factor
MLEINNTTRQKINLKTAREIVERFLLVYRKTGRTVSLAIVGDAKIKAMNKQYRGIDKTTDVLSFGADLSLVKNSSALKIKYLGEIIINIQEAARVGKYEELWQEIGWAKKPTKTQVFYFLLVHGLLHLVGYNDETEKERFEMLRKGKKFLEML